MKRSRQPSNRPYARKRSQGPLARLGAEGACGVSRLAALAGARPTVEQLEQRQLLFSLVVDPADPSFVPSLLPGYGTVTAYFGYTIPYLVATVEVEIQEPETVLEDFEDEPVSPPAPPVASGTVFAGSELRIIHNVNTVLIQTDDPPTNRWMHVSMQSGQSFTLAALSGGVPQGLPQMSMDIGDAGLDLSNTIVTLRYQGEVLDVFTGADLGSLNTTNPGTGVGTFVFSPTTAPNFDEIVFEMAAGPPVVASAFRVDNIIFDLAPGNFVPLIESHIRGVAIYLSGPIGATAQFLDLYGREMVQTIALGLPQGGNLTIVDPNDDGVPDFNDGIGKIILSGVDRLSALTMWGGPIDTNINPLTQFIEGGFAFNLAPDPLGIYDDFEASGFGFTITPGEDPQGSGLPAGSGSIIIGSPFVRDNASAMTYNPEGLAAAIPVRDGFVNPDQGIFINTGESINSIYIHGMLFGSSRLTGAADRVVLGNLYGSLSVDGDLGTLMVASDSGVWVPDIDDPLPNVVGLAFVTQSQLIVGRTLGEVTIGGRNMTDITVVGNLNNPIKHPPRDVYRYFEKEWVAAIDPDIDDGELVTILTALGNTDFASFNEAFFALLPFIPRLDQGLVYGSSFYRNDTIMSAEWVGSIATAVEIKGDLDFMDPIHTAEDPSDVYAFAADGTQTITIKLDASTFLYTRIVDQDGRVLAAAPLFDELAEAQFLFFNPDGPGVYYLVVSIGQAPDDDFATGIPYTIVLGGMASTTFGALRMSGGFTSADRPIDRFGNDEWATITLLTGNMGSLRAGTGWVTGGGADTNPADILNTFEEDRLDEMLSLRATTVSVPGRMYNITVGGDINSDGDGGNRLIHVIVGGSFGTLVTGLSELAGELGFLHGDVSALVLEAGGAIGKIDIRGGIAIDGDDSEQGTTFLFGPVHNTVIKSGKAGKGDIGMIRIGGNISGGQLFVSSSPGSTIGAFLVAQDIPVDELEDNHGIIGVAGPQQQSVNFTLGAGSDVRFADFPRIDMKNSVNASLPIVVGSPVTIQDDRGGQVLISIIGGPAGVTAGFIRSLPINSSQGVAIAQIEADLLGGRRLQITSTGGANDVVSIGRIIVTDADNASSIGISGPGQVDVWRIEQREGEAMLEIVNDTPFGDIVAIDVVGLVADVGVRIATGDLGRTQVPAWGPRLIGPFLGLTQGLTTEVNGPLGMTGGEDGAINPEWGGGIFYAVNRTDFGAGTATLEDVGSPLNGYLNGLVVREGQLSRVHVGGAVGDVITQGGDIVEVVANFDGVTPGGRFDGIVGVIFSSNNISRVEIGDGLARPESTPFSNTGVFAQNDILRVEGTLPGAFISSRIIAANITVGDGFEGIDGIRFVSLTGGGDYVEAYIGAEMLDGFWIGINPFDDAHIMTGSLFEAGGVNADFFRSDINVGNLITFALVDGFFDASRINATADIQTVTATGFRNSTLTQGGELEFHVNEIIGGQNLGLLSTLGKGDISDLLVDVLGSVTGSVAAVNISRLQLEVDGFIQLLQAEKDIRASEIVAGRLERADAGGSIRSSSFRIAGPIVQLTAADDIANVRIEASGPDGRIDLVRSRGLLSGHILSHRLITLVESTEGDVVAQVTTATEHGNVDTIKAARDLDVRTDISGTVARLIAGRHIGNLLDPGVILVHGDVALVDASGGQLYSDLRVGGSITEGVRIGRVINLPGNSILGKGSIIAFGHIKDVDVTGDFGGSVVSFSGGIERVRINDGSFLPGGRIVAHDGNINFVIINRGNLYGDIHADHILFFVTVTQSADGVFGDIGINPARSAGTPYDGFRTELPLGILPDPTFQGPRITAGHNVGRITVTGGSVFETLVHAGRAIGTLMLGGNVGNDNVTVGHGTAFVAGSLIFRVLVDGDVSDTLILAGVPELGANGRPGGVGADADRHNAGRIGTVEIGGSAARVKLSAGLTHGDDGIYNTGDDFVTLGLSFIRNVIIHGAATDVTAFTDWPLATTSPGVVVGGLDHGVQDPDLYQGPAPVPLAEVIPADGTPFAFVWGADSGLITFTGPGSAFWDASGGRIVLVNTNHNSELAVTSATGNLTDFGIVSNDDASMGGIIVNASLFGDSDIVIDNNVVLLSVNNFAGTGSIRTGGNIRTFNTGTFSGGSMTARFGREWNFLGAFGTPLLFDEAIISLLAFDTINIGGDFAGRITLERDLTALNIGGRMTFAELRSGSKLGSFTAAAIDNSRFSVRDRIGPIVVAGDVVNSNIQAGGDLGADAKPGGTGIDADRATTGHIESAVIGGNFIRTSLVAGMLRGPDGFFGTSDDMLADGRSTIGAVTIGGTQVGSGNNSEQFRIAATGSVGPVLIGGQPAVNQGNFRVEVPETSPDPIRVENLRVTYTASIYTARLTFNQPMNSATLGPALTISEVRNAGLTLIGLVEDVDYTLEYDAESNSLLVFFSTDVTGRDLPQTPGVPGPGVFRFELDAGVLRASVVNARLDGDSDGFALAGDNYSQDDIVGDAGDKLIAETVLSGTTMVDFYGPSDLDQVLDNNQTPDGLPDPNIVYTVRGFLGDHPDHDANDFRFAGDVDVYKITLRAGQILRLGAQDGSAFAAERRLFNAAGDFQGFATPDTLRLPSPLPGITDLTTAHSWLIKTTGIYYIVVDNSTIPVFNQPGVVPNFEPLPGRLGDYSFTLEVFDDRDSGFNADTDSGNGRPVADAPPPIAFAGPDGIFGTADDLATVLVGTFFFGLDVGPDGVPNTADDLVFGGDGAGIVSTRTGTGVLTSTISSAIGHPSHAGLPSTAVTPDVDIYHLNNGQLIQPGTRFRVTVKLAESGADLGTRTQFSFVDFTGAVQFGLFDTTTSTAIDDGQLVFSPTDFLPAGGTPNTVLADDTVTRYGYDANGDYFIEFVAPGRLDVPASQAAQPARYALYLQGVFNTDYRIEVVQQGSGQLVRKVQNILIETKGGTVDWLQAGEQPTTLRAFGSAALGFTGSIAGKKVDQYIITNLVDTLRTLFADAGVAVNISTNPADFEFQPYSTVFISNSFDPLRFFNEQFYGVSQRSDPFNADPNDQAVVFIPSLGVLGYTPSQADTDLFVQSLSAAVGRRIGELLGLRNTANHFGLPRDVMAANSVFSVPGPTSLYQFSSTPRPLSSPWDVLEDTQFFLGQQTAVSLLDKYLAD